MAPRKKKTGSGFDLDTLYAEAAQVVGLGEHTIGSQTLYIRPASVAEIESFQQDGEDEAAAGDHALELVCKFIVEADGTTPIFSTPEDLKRLPQRLVMDLLGAITAHNTAQAVEDEEGN